jgi:hypothetical protein
MAHTANAPEAASGRPTYRCFHGPDATLKKPTLPEFLEATRKDGAQAKIRLTCKSCGESHATANLHNLHSGYGMRCTCTGGQTEQKLGRWLAAKPYGAWDPEVSLCTNPVTGCPLQFDFVCAGTQTTIELDGPRHFFGEDGKDFEAAAVVGPVQF